MASQLNEMDAQIAANAEAIIQMPDDEDIRAIVEEELTEAKENGEFDGKDGKTAYEYAQAGGYEGTEDEFAQKLAKEIPTKLSEFVNDKEYITSSDAPVQSVNGETGAVKLTASDVGARSSSWMPTAKQVGALPDSTKIPAKTSDLINDSGFIAVGDIEVFPETVIDSSAYDSMNDGAVYENAHTPVVGDKYKIVFDGIAYEETAELFECMLGDLVSFGCECGSMGSWYNCEHENAWHIGFGDGLMHIWLNPNKISGDHTMAIYQVSETIDPKLLPPSAEIPTKVSQLENDSGFIDDYIETDPTVPAWAKNPTKPEYSKSEVGLGNVDNVRQYSANNPPPYPVTSVNGKTGAVTLDADSVGARPSTWMPSHSDVGADKSGTAASAVSTHNTNTDAHNDIRLLIFELTARFNALANSDDETLDQAAEFVAYMKANRDLIEQITTGKVSTTDIVNNLTTNVGNKPLSAAQGVALKALIDAISVPTKVSQLQNDAGYLTQHQDISGKLDASKLTEAINTALAQAKASGEFDGEDGKDADDPNAIPSYWQTALDNGVESINTALCEAGRNKSAFLFYTDAHWNYGSQMSPTLLKYLHNHTGMTKTFFGGDIVNDEATDYDTMEYLWEWRKQLKDLPNHHSVVGNHDDGGATNIQFTEQYVYGYLLGAEETHDMVMGEGLYYYVDSPAEKTRYLCLDTGFKDMSALSDKQMVFITESLKSTPDGWHIVVVAHIWYEPDYDQYNVQPIPIKGLSRTASSVAAILDNYNGRVGEFANCGAWVEFCIGGNTHRDYDNTTPNGIPILLLETDSHHIRSGLSCTAGTTTEASVNGIVADYDAKRIKVIRIGRGTSRQVEMTWYEVSYTNVLPLAVSADGVSIYNADDTPGYKANVRWSTSSNAESSSNASGLYLTGFIPVNMGDVIRLKNITMNKANANSNGCHIHSFASLTDTDEGTKGGDMITNYAGGIWDEDGNLIQFTISYDIEKFIRLQGTYFGPDSIITINEPLA